MKGVDAANHIIREVGKMSGHSAHYQVMLFLSRVRDEIVRMEREEAESMTTKKAIAQPQLKKKQGKIYG